MSAPTINVNLASCSRHHLPLHREESRYHVLPGTGNLALCEAPPVPVPLSLEPWRSVTMKVRLGECATPLQCIFPHMRGEPRIDHHGTCPALPIEVTCSMRGKTWAESHVCDAETERGTTLHHGPLKQSVHERWSLIKALVTGEHPDHDTGRWTGPTLPLFEHRDAVYAAVCEVARTEASNLAAQERLVSLLDPKRAMFRPTPEDRRPSAHGLAIYVARLIEQVGVMS